MVAEGIKGNLVSVEWLEKNLKDNNVIIIDASPCTDVCGSAYSRRTKWGFYNVWSKGNSDF